MQKPINNQAKEIEELEGSPCTGRELSDEQALQIYDYYLSGEYLIRNLEIVREEKQKALEGLAHLEAIEQSILDRMQKQNISIQSDQQNG
ncbi:hypothetical protein F7734_60270 [Scytonema sp. UIC 10036]|uniref:hypothetical protein n=1 Tax=Scytonema sp. UIC 10036 TaxID=2304196 RepID=UPI0012DA188D|nr:hypothetical protein [Scytonema sp. UIC 10036]MUH01860.1 hypothetical protein [Scytonema sp. UIC 10036]